MNDFYVNLHLQDHPNVIHRRWIVTADTPGQACTLALQMYQREGPLRLACIPRCLGMVRAGDARHADDARIEEPHDL